MPEIIDWQASIRADFDIEDWITVAGDAKLAIGYSFIFWPQFREHENCVFLKSHFSVDNFNEWKGSEFIKHYAQIESVINHIHVLDLFPYEKQNDISYEQVKYIGNILTDIYRVKLKAEFPERKFTVSFNGEEPTDDLIDYQLTFFQQENESIYLNKETSAP